MENNLQVFTSEEFGSIRVLVIDDEPWFVARDVTVALGYKNTQYILQSRVDSDDKQTIQRKKNPELPSSSLTFVNESGLYSLALASELPTARKFMQWVTVEVIPSVCECDSEEENQEEREDTNMSDIQIFRHGDFGEIRTLTIDGEPWFVGKDVATLSRYKDTKYAIRNHVNDKDKKLCKISTNGGEQEMNIINENGLHSLIRSSKLPILTATKLKRWVTEEILPSIRRRDSKTEIPPAPCVDQTVSKNQPVTDNLQVINIDGIECYEKDGVAYLNLEAVAWGLGFTTTQTINGTEYTNVRWNTVYQYLKDIRFLQEVAKNSPPLPEYIPENIFYRLAMKANNAAAVKFQEKIANEVLPSLRKHGAYMTPETLEQILMNPDTIIKLATALKEEQEQRKALEAENQVQSRQIEAMRPAQIFADAVSASEDTILIRELAKLLKQNGVDIGEKRLFTYLRDNKYLISQKGADYNLPTQRAMDMGLFVIVECTINTSSGEVKVRSTPRVTGKGQSYFINKFLAMSEQAPDQIGLF